MGEQTGGKTRSKAMGCVVAALVPITLLGLAALVFVINNRPVNVTVPTHSVPKDNALDYYARAAKAIKRIGPLSDPKGAAHWTMADYKLFMKDDAAAFALVRQGLTKPCVCPPIRGMQGLSANPFLQMSQLRELARTLRSESMYYEKVGNYGQAVESQLDAVELGVSSPGKGCLIQDLVGVACAAIGYKEIEQKLPNLTTAELARAAAHLDRIQKRAVPYSEIVEEEGYIQLSTMKDLFGGPGKAVALFAPTGMLPYGSSTPTAQDYIESAKFAFANKARVFEEVSSFHKSLAAETRKPYTGSVKTPQPSSSLIQLLCGSMSSAWLTHLRCQTRIALIQTDVALLRYKADNGRYPNRLEQLAPKYLKSAPIDPFGGKVLRYRMLDGGKDFILYSVGPNVKDDGGTPGKWSAASTTGDMVLGRGI